MSFPATEMLVGTSIYTKSQRIESIRNMAADIHTETMPDSEINIIATRKDNKVFNLTSTFDWTETDSEFPLVIDASNCYTAAEILRGLTDSQYLQEANDLESKADLLIEEINGQSVVGMISTTETTTGIGGTQNGTFN